MKKQLPILWKPLNCLYVHINKLNNKKYFGITCRRPKERWANGRGYNQTQCAFYNAIQKYGWDGFEHKVIFKNLERLFAEELETYFINIYQTTNVKYGYNISKGVHSSLRKTTKQRIAQANSLKKKVICLETKIIYRSISQAAKVLNASSSAIRNCCCKHKNNFTCKGFHFMFLDEYKTATADDIKKWISKTKTLNTKPVICLETKQIFGSVTQAKKVFGNVVISACCQGKNLTAAGFHWLYLKDYKQKTQQQIDNIINPPYYNNEKEYYRLPKNKIAVICLETEQIFSSITQAAEKLNLPRASISSVCNLEDKHNKTVVNKHFMYYKDYVNCSKEEIQKILNNKPGIIRKQVVCLTNNTVYENAHQAACHLNLFSRRISENCRNKIVRPIKGFCFQYLEDYVGDKTNLIFEPAINYNKKRKAQRVICLNTNKVYASILQAHKQTSCNQNEILRCCNHLITNTKGFKWMYEDEYKRSVFNEYKK